MLTEQFVPTCRQMLGALSAWLQKAETELPDERALALLSARLADDMFPLSTQVRFACVQAYEGVCRLRGEAFPAIIDELLAEGRGAGEESGTLVTARKRIDETLSFLRSLAPDALDVDPDAPVAHALPNGMVFDLTAQQYVRDWALAQFCFHVMIAYAIMRKEGVNLGKADYVAHLFPYLRPGTLPSV